MLSPGKKRLALGITIALIVWIIIQSALSLSGFYLESFELPPRALLILLPPILAMIVDVIVGITAPIVAYLYFNT